MKFNTLLLLNILIVLFTLLAVEENTPLGIKPLIGLVVLFLIWVEFHIFKNKGGFWQDKIIHPPMQETQGFSENPYKEINVKYNGIPYNYDEEDFEPEYKYPSDFVSTDYWPEDKPYPFQKIAKRKAQRILIPERKIARRKARRI